MNVHPNQITKEVIGAAIEVHNKLQRAGIEGGDSQKSV